MHTFSVKSFLASFLKTHKTLPGGVMLKDRFGEDKDLEVIKAYGYFENEKVPNALNVILKVGELLCKK